MEKTSKKKLAVSAVLVVASIALLLGLTLAWFTDTVTNKGNKIESGTLDIEVAAAPLDPSGTTYTVAGLNGGNPFGFDAPVNVEGDTAAPIISETKWEPGQSNAKLVTVINKGALAAKVKLQFKSADFGLENALWFDFIQVHNGIVGGSFVKRPMSSLNALADQREFPIAPGGSVSFILAYGMDETAGNEYQDASYEAIVNVVATQGTSEMDGFGSDQYDATASYPWNDATVTPVVPDESGIYNPGTAAELAWISQEVGNGNLAGKPITIKLQQDIDLAGIEWAPIGAEDGKVFMGVFDGNGHTISNLKVNQNYASFYDNRGIGLIGYAENATIKNLKIENCSMSGRYGVSAVVGTGASPLTFENIEVLSGTVLSDQNVPGEIARVAGGILGQGWGSTGSTIVFRNCVNSANITVNKWHAGGLWGSITTDGVGQAQTILVENCINKGSITASEGFGYAGGLGGFAVADNCVITGSENKGTLAGKEPKANFVASFNGKKIEDNTQ